jgi:diacylglycerol kinase family enzyme
VHIVINRAARRLAEGGGLRDVIVRAAGSEAAVHETRHLSELGRVAARIAARGADVVVLAGGDGSYMAGVTALERAFGDAMPAPGLTPEPPLRSGMPAIALAPGGTVCTVAKNWGMRGAAHAYAERIVRAAIEGTGEVARRPTLRVRDDAGGDRIGFIFGAGLVASFFDVYYREKDPGTATAASIIARVFAGSFVGGALAKRVLDPTPCTLHVDGVEQEARAWSLVVAGVVRDVGLHMHVTYRAGEERDRFHIVASGLAPRALGPQLPRVVAGRPLRGSPHVDTLARDVVVRFEAMDSGTSPSGPSGREPHAQSAASRLGCYVLDGDAVRAREVRVAAGPVIGVLHV